MKTYKQVFKCDYFTVEELAAGAYAAVASEEGGALSNSGIIDLGDRTVVFDTFLSADAAHELRRFAEAATGRKAAYIINSHCHFDHNLGNCSFDTDTEVLATLSSYAELRGHMDEIDAMRKDAPGILVSLWEKLQEETDELSRKMLERDIRYFEMLKKDSFRLRLPDATFEGERELVGTARRAVLLELSGHTSSDTVLYLPEDRLVFTGDLLFTGTHPWLGAGDPEVWIDTLQGLRRQGAELLIPGHGNIGEPEDIQLLEEYIGVIESIAGRLNSGEIELKDVQEGMLEEPFRSWKGNKFLPNVKFCIQYLCRDKK